MKVEKVARDDDRPKIKRPCCWVVIVRVTPNWDILRWENVHETSNPKKMMFEAHHCWYDYHQMINCSSCSISNCPLLSLFFLIL